jgi:hypothetical protein
MVPLLLLWYGLVDPKFELVCLRVYESYADTDRAMEAEPIFSFRAKLTAPLTFHRLLPPSVVAASMPLTTASQNRAV